MRILVTGGAGHIGSKLVPFLYDYGRNQISVIDDLSTQRYASLLDWSRNGVRVSFLQSDIRNDDMVEAVIAKCDVVVHLAALTDAANSQARADEMYDVNLRGTSRIMEACVKLGRPMLFPSTTSVYGLQDGLVDESCPILRPQSPYAESKLSAESLLMSIPGSELVTILRFGTIYGWSIGMRFHTAVNLWAWLAAQDLPIKVWRTAIDQKRPYLYLGDACRAIEHVIKNELWGSLYNVVSGNHTPRQITSEILRYRPDAKVVLDDWPSMNQLSYEVSGAKFEATRYEPWGTIERGIMETMSALSGIRGT